MTVPLSRFAEPEITDFLNKFNLSTCWLLNFRIVVDPEPFLRNAFFTKYKEVGFVVNETQRDKSKQLVEIARRNNVAAIAYLSRYVKEDSFLICVKR